jgi:hypothetical protein
MGFPAGLEPGYRLQDQLVETLRPAAVQRHPRRGEDAPQPAAMPVPPPDPRGSLRVSAVAAVHVPRVTPGGPERPGGRTLPRRPLRHEPRGVPWVMAFGSPGEYGLPL